MSAIAGSTVTALIGIFVMLSPWLTGIDDGHQAWSRATTTDFWSGTGILALGIVNMLLYRSTLKRELLTTGVVSRTPVVYEPVSQAPPAAPALTDEALLSLATSIMNDLQSEHSGAHAAPSQALATHEDSPVSEADLVRLAQSLLGEIQGTNSAVEQEQPVVETPPEPPVEEPLALVSEAELVQMAANLLEEIQRTRQTEMVRTGGDMSRE